MLELLKGTEIQGRYVIVDLIGTGGFASVWKASDKQLNRHVAIKRLSKPAASAADEAKRALEEAKKNAQIVHTNIVQVYDVIQVDGEPLIIMEYVDGPSLHQLLRDKALRGEVIPPDQAAAMLRDVLSGLAFAHDKKICHRDLSPMNILVTVGGVPKIADFGIARILEPAKTPPMTPELLQHGGTGNPYYMAPEQARGEPADYSSDLFMVGIIGYLLLSGRHPFTHPTGLFSIPELIRDPTF